MTPDDFSRLITQLIARGEDRDELEFWQEIYPALDPSDQAKLYNNLKSELAGLINITS